MKKKTLRKVLKTARGAMTSMEGKLFLAEERLLAANAQLVQQKKHIQQLRIQLREYVAADQEYERGKFVEMLDQGFADSLKPEGFDEREAARLAAMRRNVELMGLGKATQG